MGLPSSPAGGVVAAALLVLLLPFRALCVCSIQSLPSYAEPIGDARFLSTFPVGTTLQLNCIPGYDRIHARTTTVTCLNNSIWTVVPMFCRPVECPTPLIPNGRLLGIPQAQYKYPDVVRFVCNTGYTSLGRQTINCGTDKTWKPSTSVCALTVCMYWDLPPRTVPIGAARQQHMFPIGTTLQLDCMAGYEYIPGSPSTVTCLSNVTWAPTTIFCIRIMCPAPIIANGRLLGTPQVLYSLRHVVQFECNPGYASPGPMSVTCGVDKTWKPSSPVCIQSVKCPAPNIANGRLLGTPQAEYTHNDVVQFECNPGYTSSGPISITCGMDKTWKPSNPICIKSVCSIMGLPSYAETRGDARYYYTFPVGTILQLHCIPGYEHIPGTNSNFTCLNNLSWSFVPTFCRRVVCPAPNITNGRLLGTPQAQYAYFDVVSFECDPGYISTGPQLIMCGINQIWEPSTLVCILGCPAPNITNGRLLGTPQARYRYYDVVSFKCNPGYTSSGPQLITCEINQTWVPSTSVCILGGCLIPNLPSHSELSGEESYRDSYPVGSTLQLDCTPGYEHIPGITPNITCLNNLMWSVLPTFCQGVVCLAPKIANARLLGTPSAQYKFPDFVWFECNPGYTAVGPVFILCGIDKTWQPSIPVCTRQFVPPPEDISEEAYWKTLATALGCVLAALVLAFLFFVAVTMFYRQRIPEHPRSAPPTPPPPPPPPPPRY